MFKIVKMVHNNRYTQSLTIGINLKLFKKKTYRLLPQGLTLVSTGIGLPEVPEPSNGIVTRQG